jgi:hypothetical protein
MPQNSADSEKKSAKSAEVSSLRVSAPLRLKSSTLLDTRVGYCGDNLEQLAKPHDACVDLIYPATAGQPRCVQLARVLKQTGSFYYPCDWHHQPLHQGHARPDFRAKIILKAELFRRRNVNFWLHGLAKILDS